MGVEGVYDYAAAKNANEYLKLAAKTPDGFYGMLARKALGMSNGLNMTIDFKETNFASNILNYSKGKRAVALIQLSKYKSAEEELRRLYYEIPGHEHFSLMVFAEKTGSPGLAMRIAGLLKEEDCHPITQVCILSQLGKYPLMLFLMQH